MPRRLPHSVYLAFFSSVAATVKAAGFEAFPQGGIFTVQEMDRMDESCERGEAPDVFAAWLIAKRGEEAKRELAESDLNMGNETISPNEVAA